MRRSHNHPPTLSFVGVIGTMLIGGFTAPPDATAAPTDGVLGGQSYASDRVLVGLPGPVDAGVDVDAVVGPLGGVASYRFPSLGIAVVQTLDPETFIENARATSAFRFVERDPLVVPTQAPNDLDYERQWGLTAIQAPTAWQHTRGAGVIVAVLDSGVRWSHPDLVTSMWVNNAEVPGNLLDDDGNGYVDDVIGWDFIDEDADPDPAPDCGAHGTHVAGIVAAAQDNLVGGTGVAPGAKLMPLKMICIQSTASVAMQALQYAIDNGAKVVQGSWGLREPSQAFAEMARWAHQERGVLLVQAAGNGGDEGVAFPARLPEFMAVGALAQDLSVPSWSSRGPEVEIAAPGSIIYSTYTLPLHAALSGTSMAAPHVSGVAALIMSHEPHLTSAEVRDRLTATAVDLGPPGRDDASGYGIVNASAALGVP